MSDQAEKIKSLEADVKERDEIIEGQAATIKALEAERDALKADPGITPTITVDEKTYAVRVAKFRYKREGVDEDPREYSVADLQADAELQAELVGKKVGFLELVKPAVKAA
ncbi:hypothetical protein [Fibrella forsythiae]|uniref:Uncharacterized protein n=1 Tax=Fibrella forsythiae TaxID=2817061 RepID=A0ABS3JM40_9BACT|nr:hypothetical protein [Fibrella forsythiae]MBO0951072.1 hypothetical protein [Fibrella forsythiae]